MTPLDKAREALAAVEKATAGEWQVWTDACHFDTASDIRVDGRMVAQTVSHYPALVHDAAAIVSAVNFVRADLPALIAALEEKEPAVTNGTLETRHYAPAADMARRICSYAIGNARANVYDAALNALTEAAAEHERLADRVAKLEGALRGARAALHQHYVDWDGEPEDAVPLSLARDACDALLTPAEGAEDGR
jgi:hypothetical protein